MADPIQDILDSLESPNGTQYKITDYISYLTAVKDWVKVLQLKAGITEEDATYIIQQAIEQANALMKTHSGLNPTSMQLLPFFSVLVSADEKDRKLEIAKWTAEVKTRAANQKVLEEQTQYEKDKTYEQVWLKGQSEADNANALNLLIDLPKYTDDTLAKLLPRYIGAPREAILKEMQNRGLQPISDFAQKVNPQNVTPEQAANAEAALKINPNDADALHIFQAAQTQKSVKWATDILKWEPNNPVAQQILYQAGAPGGQPALQAEEARKKAIEGFVPPEQPGVESAYGAAVSKISPELQGYYKKSLGSVYNEFQATGGDALRAEWWKTLSLAQSGLLTGGASTFVPSPGTVSRAKAQGLDYEHYLNTAKSWMENKDNPGSAFLGLSAADKQGLTDTYNEWNVALKTQQIIGQRTQQTRLSAQDPWQKFLETYDWGADPYRRGLYTGYSTPPARWI